MFREFVGILLRTPVVMYLGICWILFVWSLIVTVALCLILVKPLFYPFICLIAWLWHAFIGSKKKVLPKYWEEYPGRYLKWCKMGFPTLIRWWFKGFQKDI